MSFNTHSLYVLCIILLSSSISMAQADDNVMQHKKDSLYKIIFDNRADIAKRNLAIQTINVLGIPMEDTVRNQIDLLLNDKGCTGKYWILLNAHKGSGFVNQNDMQSAEISFEAAYKRYKSLKNIDVNVTFMESYAGVLNNLGKNSEAVAIYLEALAVREKEGNFKDISDVNFSLGNLMADVSKLEESTKYYEKALQYANKTNYKYGSANALEGLGLNAMNVGEFTKSETFLKQAIIIYASINKTQNEYNCKNNLGIVYEELGRYDAARQIYNDVEQYFIKTKNKSRLANVNMDKGLLEMKSEDFAKAIQYLTLAKTQYIADGDIQAIKDVNYYLFDAARKNGNYKDALSYHEQYVKYKDSLINENNIQKITELRKDFEFNKEKEVITLENAKKVEREQAFQKYLALGLALLAGMLFFAFRAYRIKAKANATITAQKDQLEKYNTSNENLIYSLSHDIKEPMMGVQFLLQKIKSDDPYIQKATTSINDQVSSINSIVSNLLLLKKTSGADVDQSTSIDSIDETVNKIIQELDYKIIDKNLSIQNNILTSPDVLLPLSSQKLYISLLNLMTNAIKHTPNGGMIELFTKSDGVYVRDNGTGIPPSIIDKLGREHIDKNDKSGGSGMGLVLVSNMLAESKMRLTFENVNGGGTLAGVVLV